MYSSHLRYEVYISEVQEIYPESPITSFENFTVNGEFSDFLNTKIDNKVINTLCSSSNNENPNDKFSASYLLHNDDIYHYIVDIHNYKYFLIGCILNYPVSFSLPDEDADFFNSFFDDVDDIAVGDYVTFGTYTSDDGEEVLCILFYSNALLKNIDSRISIKINDEMNNYLD